MKIRAILFDIYKTILDVSAPPDDAVQRWEKLCAATFGKPARLTLQEFAAACQGIIAREHASARRVGIAFPEIDWPTVTREALPELDALPPEALDDFLFQHAQMQRTVRLMKGAGDFLAECARRNWPLGIASNSQPYTLRELATALDEAKLNRDIFNPHLCFLSFENGFSKPDPHVFRLLAARLHRFGIAPEEALMVGDRLDNDIVPASAIGFRVWQLTETPGENAGPWKELKSAVFS